LALNKGVLTAENSEIGDEKYTPFYAVEPLIKYIDKYDTIWCPFDKEWSAYVQRFKENGNKVIFSHIDYGQDFFEYEPKEHYDVIISNPPFSKKVKVLKRLEELKKPYCILLPLGSLQGEKQFQFLKFGAQLLCFKYRICYYKGESREVDKEVPFASAYFAKDFLPKDLIVSDLDRFDRELVR